MIAQTQIDGLIALSRRPAIRLGLVFLAAGLFAYASVRVVRHQIRYPADGDWGVYYRAGLAMRLRQPIYTLDHGPMLTFKNAPVVAVMLMPISLLPIALARWLWLIADLASVAMTYRYAGRMIFRQNADRRTVAMLSAGAVLLSAHYIFDELFSGPTAAMVLAVTVAAFVWAHEGKGCRAGIALAIAICMKLVPLAFVPWLLCCKSRWTSLAALVVSMAVLNILPAAWIGWTGNEQLLREWPRHLARTEIFEQEYRDTNQSVNAAITRFLTTTPYHVNFVAIDPRAAKLLNIGLMAIAAIAIYGVIIVRQSRGRNEPGAAVAMLLIYMTIFNPLAWRYNFVALGVAYLFVLQALMTTPVRRPRLIISLTLISYLFHFAPKIAQEFSARLLGTLALAAAVWLCWGNRAGEEDVATAAARNTALAPVP